MQSGANGWALKRVIQVWLRKMADENKKPISVGINENSFELILRILGNEFIAIRIGSTNFSGKLIAGSILLLFFTFMLLEVFGLSRILGIE
jgi:ADP-dependent phosphofructokinase/glucokinase